MSAIGIDLGSYNSVAAYATDGADVHIIRSDYGNTGQGCVFPSFVRFDGEGQPVAFGERARLEMAQQPESVVWGVKRLIGKPFEHAVRESARFAYRVQSSQNGGVSIVVGPNSLAPADVSSLVLNWIKRCAENPKLNPFLLDQQVQKAVITHPAYFDTAQIEATREAAKPVFSELELISEPVAAAIAFGVELNPGEPQFIMVIDWGAGTLDIVVVALMVNSAGRPIISEVKPARGDLMLGGIDMDDVLLKRAVELYDLDDLAPLLNQNRGQSLGVSDAGVLTGAEQWRELCQLREVVEKGKINLSRQPTWEAHAIYKGNPVRLRMALSERDRLDRASDWIFLDKVLEPLLQRFREQIKFALDQTGMGPRDIHHVLLIGGPMQLRCVRTQVLDIFKKNSQITAALKQLDRTGFSVNPMEGVARGAALSARSLGPSLGKCVIARDYGVLLGPFGHEQGETLIQDGDPVGREYETEDPLTCPGNPGNSVQVGMFKKETSPHGDVFTRMGAYTFVPTFGPEGARFLPILRAERDKTVSLKIKDLLTGSIWELPRLSVLDGRQIQQPRPFSRKEAPPTELPPVNFEDTVSQGKVASLRRRGNAILRVGDMKQNHPRVQNDASLRADLFNALRRVHGQVNALPETGPMDQNSFTAVAKAVTELEAFLDTSLLVTDQERKLLDASP